MGRGPIGHGGNSPNAFVPTSHFSQNGTRSGAHSKFVNKKSSQAGFCWASKAEMQGGTLVTVAPAVPFGAPTSPSYHPASSVLDVSPPPAPSTSLSAAAAADEAAVGCMPATPSSQEGVQAPSLSFPESPNLSLNASLLHQETQTNTLLAGRLGGGLPARPTTRPVPETHSPDQKHSIFFQLPGRWVLVWVS